MLEIFNEYTFLYLHFGLPDDVGECQYGLKG